MMVLMEMFPKVRKNQAVTGNIPMTYFEAHESDIRREMRYQKFKVAYRGPRISNAGYYPTTTRRCDATSVLIYRR